MVTRTVTIGTVILIDDVWKIAEARWTDAVELRKAQRPAGAIYLCGYALELGLKARICKTLGWDGWPDAGEFGKLASFKTHDLPTLLHVSGVEIQLKGEHSEQWAQVSQWDPEVRYKTPDEAAGDIEALMTVSATRMLLDFLKK